MKHKRTILTTTLLSSLLILPLVAQNDLVVNERVAGKAEASAVTSITLGPGFHGVEGCDFRASNIVLESTLSKRLFINIFRTMINKSGGRKIADIGSAVACAAASIFTDFLPAFSSRKK